MKDEGSFGGSWVLSGHHSLKKHKIKTIKSKIDQITFFGQLRIVVIVISRFFFRSREDGWGPCLRVAYKTELYSFYKVDQGSTQKHYNPHYTYWEELNNSPFQAVKNLDDTKNLFQDLETLRHLNPNLVSKDLLAKLFNPQRIKKITSKNNKFYPDPNATNFDFIDKWKSFTIIAKLAN